MLNSPNLHEVLLWVIKDLHSKGWSTGTAGNFSAVLQREPLTLLMTPSGIDKGLVRSQDLVEINEAGAVVKGTGKPSSETLLHLTIVRETGMGAIIHTHSVFNTILSQHFLPEGKLILTGYEMLKGLEGILTHETIVNIPIWPNSQDMQQLSQIVGSHLRLNSHYGNEEMSFPRTYGFLLAGHGLYTWGETLFHARRHLEILEFLFEVTYRQLVLAD